MGGDLAPVLQRHRIFDSRDAEEARDFLRTQEFRLDMSAREARHVDTRINGVFLPSIYLGYLQYGAASEIRANQSRDDYRILPPVRGSLEAVIGNDVVACARGRAILTSPTLSKVVRSERGSAWLNIFLNGAALRRHLAALLGEPLKAPLEFAPAIDLGSGYGRGLTHYLRSAMTDLDQTTPLMNSITTSLFEQFVMVGLLLAHPHNYSAALCRPARSIAPRDVRRAIDYIEANLDAPIVLADIVAASEVAGRTLAQHFRRFRDTTPMRYLRNARLDKVREALHRAEPEKSVMSIAINWGFGHMGRFSAEYHKRFGEAPSQTLSRSRPTRRM